MHQEKILKLAKGLEIFTQDDVQCFCNLNKDEIEETLKILLKENKISKISDNRYKLNLQSKHKAYSFELVETIKEKAFDNQNITFIQANKYFLSEHVYNNCTPSTFRYYSSISRNHLIPFFKNIELKEIDINDIKRLIKDNEIKRLDTKFSKNIVTLLAQMLRYFENKGFIKRNHNFQIKNIHNSKKQIIKLLSEVQVQEMLDIAKKEFKELYPILIVAIYTGLKKSEILALKINDIDIKNNRININKTLYLNELLPIKCSSSLRQIEIPYQVKKAIKKQIKCKNPDSLVFLNPNLSPISSENKLKLQFEKLKNRLELKNFKFNDLRHTYAYKSLQAGMSIDYLHKQLGGYSIQATMDKYKDFII